MKLRSAAPLVVAAASLALPCLAERQAPLEGGAKSKGRNPLDEAFRKRAEGQLAFWKVPGMAIGVVDGDDLWSSGYGYATLPDTKADASTLWMVGSTSKAFTAAAMSLYINNSSSIAWETPISSIIRDDFVLPSTYATSHVTIEDALSHRTGMPRHDYGYGSTEGTSDYTLKSLVRSLRHMPLSAELRTKYQYCNMMYQTIAYVLETLTSTSLGSYLEENLLHPLGMHSTYFNTEAALASSHHLARGYHTKEWYSDPTTTFLPVKHENLSQLTGAGSIASNVLDYQKWIQSWLKSTGPLSHNGQQANLFFPRMLQKDAATAAATADQPATNPFTGPLQYALGWDIGVYRGHQFFQHGGGMEAFGTNVIIFPSLNYGLVAFGNTALTSNWVEFALQWWLIDEKLGVPEADRFDWNALSVARMADIRRAYDDAKQLLYPDAPKPALPPSLPLAAYAGTYNDAGYGNVTVYWNATDASLRADRTDAIFAAALEFEHVSGEFFVALVDSIRAPGNFIAASPAEFEVGSKGLPVRLGIAWEPALGEQKIWFDRI